MPKLSLSIRFFVVLALLPLLSACDFRPVAAGDWDVQVGNGSEVYAQFWSISDEGMVRIEPVPPDGSAQTARAQLTGGRMSFAMIGADADSSFNFSGTVDGNRFTGTLYTQHGNHSVNAVRR